MIVFPVRKIVSIASVTRTVHSMTKDLKLDLDHLDEILSLLRPVENLFQLMLASDPEVHGKLAHESAEIGLSLTNNLRKYLEKISELQAAEPPS